MVEMATTFSEVAGGHLFQSPRSFDETDIEGKVPKGLRRVVLQALEKSPDQRFSSTKEFSRHLAEFCDPQRSFQDEWHRSVEVSAVSMAKAKPFKKPGSTQNRLDRDFGLVTTPSSPGIFPSSVSALKLSDSVDGATPCVSIVRVMSFATGTVSVSTCTVTVAVAGTLTPSFT